MKVIVYKNRIEAIRELSDPRYYGTINAAGESKLLYAICRELKKQGFDVIKKRMHKDGHLVDDMQQYIRDRKGKWAVYNDHWAICGLNDDFNKGQAVLALVEL
jgi:hypothetical protein